MSAGVGPGSALRPRVAVVPVKPLAAAKSRMSLPAWRRRELALAFAVDTIEAVLASPLVREVLVVTSDPLVADRVGHGAVRVVAERGSGLGNAVRDGVRESTRVCPGSGVVVVPADLPCLRADDVTAVIASAAVPEGAFVPDRAGTGTTMLLPAVGGPEVARYGPGSAAAHRSLGLRAQHDAPVRARHDVDTVGDLDAAVLLGLGRATAAVLRSGDRPTVLRRTERPIR